jgi:hypothetical protein
VTDYGIARTILVDCAPRLGLGWTVGQAALGATIRLAELKRAESSIDFYSFLRSAYCQSRRQWLREALGLPSEVASPAGVVRSYEFRVRRRISASFGVKIIVASAQKALYLPPLPGKQARKTQKQFAHPLC